MQTGGGAVMKRIKRKVTPTILIILVLFTWIPKSAYAYLDPGTGSYLVQILIAGLIGASYAIKLYWKSIRSFFSRSTDAEQQPEETDDD